MKLGIVASMIMAAAFGWVPPTSAQWLRTLDARPEAIATGAALLCLASILRRGVVARRTP
jgi:hypothetical protein